MSVIGPVILEYDYFPDAAPAIVGGLVTGQTVNIQLWENSNLITVLSSGCLEIGSTGRYSWSTSGLPTMTASRQQFHWRMSDGINEDDGDFVLISHENYDGGMPSLKNKGSYIIQN